MLTAQDIREKFVQFFEKKGHSKVASSSLIPQNDPTIMFANAGMNQFKDYFTGKANPENTRAVSIQKCVRAGGKHNDLENVGFTARHHTFFEMLGNFSFGDYFKSEAIAFAWEFLTKELNIPADKLYITVHDSDEEARMIWHKEIGIPLDRIFYMGDKDNFWEMGDVGPCGPSSEIFYDHGPDHSDGSDTSECLLHDESRYVEIWNLVFMQYEKFINTEGEIERRELPKPSIDTGAGLERLSACLQNVYWNYDIDTFKPIIDLLEKISGKKYTDKDATTSMRVICDHIRSAVMLITDGVIPGNEGRGYVLRRIIRRAIRHLNELGIKEISFYKLIPAVFEKLGEEYPQNLSNVALAEKMLKLEEERFRKTLKTGLELLKTEISDFKPGDILSGEISFKLYDTYGFPIDLTQTILEEKGFALDQKGYEEHMARQKESSKASSNFKVQENNLELYYQVKEKFGETEFTGHTEANTQAKLLATIEEDQFVALIFNKTPFYSEGGGQVGDTGFIYDTHGNQMAKVIDTQSPVEGLIVHYCDEVSDVELEQEYLLSIQADRRALIKRNHSATHLLQAALIKVLGAHVKQSGSRVSEESLRFDFTHPEAMTREQINQVEILVNQQIALGLPVQVEMMSKDDATAKGAMALFGEKYGDTVRTLLMGDFSFELCGGTHVQNTSEIGSFVITSESSLSSGVRRIEAVSSLGAMNYLNARSNTLAEIERIFSTGREQIVNRIQGLQKDLKSKNKEIESLQDKLQEINAKSMFDHKIDLGKEFQLVLSEQKGVSPKDFRSLSDKFINQNKKDVLLLLAEEKGKLSYLLRTAKENKEIHCSQILKNSQEVIGGRGGGKPDMAQGSGAAENKAAFVEKIKSELKGV
ncbi:MAG: alanine--tRNA ligase [Halobacteriovoraceae bacterium]|nr:alanine--tRNA ligase [Halobacteriovoraceae bacterium]|tara:strand:- start:6131 stop:8749 length:2619 start_codon:yes stop_codon:yes gene_type:complete